MKKNNGYCISIERDYELYERFLLYLQSTDTKWNRCSSERKIESERLS